MKKIAQDKKVDPLDEHDDAIFGGGQVAKPQVANRPTAPTPQKQNKDSDPLNQADEAFSGKSPQISPTKPQAEAPTVVKHTPKTVHKSQSVQEMQLALLDLGKFIANTPVYKDVFDKGSNSPLLKEIETPIDTSLLNKIVASLKMDKTGKPDGVWGGGTQSAIKSLVVFGKALIDYAKRHGITLNYFGPSELNALTEISNISPNEVNDKTAIMATQLINEFNSFLHEMQNQVVANRPKKDKSLDQEDELTKDFDKDPNNRSLSEQIPGISVEINGSTHPVSYNNIKNVDSFVAFVKQFYPKDQEIPYDHIYKAMNDIAKAIDANISGGNGIYRVSPI